MSPSIRRKVSAVPAGAMLSVVAIAMSYAVALAAERKPAERRGLSGRAQVTSAEDRINAALDAATDVEFTDHPLNEVADFLGESYDINILLDEVALADEGIATDAPVTLVLSRVTLRSTLNVMLKPLKLTYIVEDEVLKITTIAHAESSLLTRIYDVRVLEEAGFGVEDLAHVVTRCVRADSWLLLSANRRLTRAAAGPSRQPTPVTRPTAGKGAVEPLPGCLVISQSFVAHREIAELLQRLEQYALRRDRAQ